MKATKQAMKLGLPHHLILAALGRYEYLTASQCCDLHYSPKSITYVRHILHELCDADYVGKTRLVRTIEDGSFPAIFFLNRKGYNHLEALELAPEIKFRSPSDREREAAFLQHTIEANSFLILCHKLARLGRVGIASMKTERELKRMPIKVRDFGGKKDDKIQVVNDGWIALTADGNQFPLGVELDRGTVGRDAFTRKIRGLLAFDGGPYQELFGTEYLTILFCITQGGEKRLRDLLKWTGEELTRLRMQAAADLFRFGVINFACDPLAVIYGPTWHRPFDARPVPLIGG